MSPHPSGPRSPSQLPPPCTCVLWISLLTPPLPARADLRSSLERERREECPQKYQNGDGETGSMTDGCEARGWPLSQSPCPFPLKGVQIWVTVARPSLPSSQPLPRDAAGQQAKGGCASASLETCAVFAGWAPRCVCTESGSGKYLPSMCTYRIEGLAK